MNRGKINIEYNGESGHEFWKRLDNSKVWGDVVCVNQVGDQTIVEFVVTRVSTEFFSIGTHIAMTVKDLGNPGNGQTNDQWSNLIMIDGPCSAPIIPLRNEFLGFLEADGNIVVDY